MGLHLHKPSLMGLLLLVLQFILLVLAVMNFIFSGEILSYVVGALTIVLVICGVVGVLTRHRILLIAFGIFALVLFGLATLNFILCIINSCGVSTLVNGGFFIGFYLCVLACTLSVYAEASATAEYSKV